MFTVNSYIWRYENVSAQAFAKSGDATVPAVRDLCQVLQREDLST